MKINKEAGQASKLFLVLAIVILIAGVMVYLVMKMATPTLKPTVSTIKPTSTPTPGPVYQKQINDINFVSWYCDNSDKKLILLIKSSQ